MPPEDRLVETFWGIVLLLVMYFVIPIAIFAATIVWLSGKKNSADGA
jgi:hypothetical protein